MKQPTRMHFSDPVRLFLALVMGWALTHGLAADERADTAINRARAYLGSEEALGGVHSVRYQGTMATTDGDEGTVDIVFMRPYFQLIVVEVENVRQTTALSGYDGWEKVEDMNNVDDWQLTLLEAPQIRRLQANAWESLNFYKVNRQKKVVVTYEGETEIDGITCDEIAFRHDRTIRFVRYFDVATGRLVLSTTEQGGEIREEGELMVDGIRFPKRLLTTVGENSSTIEFELIEVNQSYDEALFDVPMLMPSPGS